MGVKGGLHTTGAKWFMIESLKILKWWWEATTTSFKLLAVLLALLGYLYIVQILKKYVILMETIEENNRKRAKECGMCVIHNFTYSWRTGVSLTAVHLSSKELKTENSNINPSHEEEKTKNN
jgi:hypothetical protein